MRHLRTILIFLLASMPLVSTKAQNVTEPAQSQTKIETTGDGNIFRSLGHFYKEDLYANNIFRRLEIGVSIGTDGLGLDFATKITNYVRLRAGISWMPPFNVPMHFGLENYTETGGVTNDNFDNLQGYLKKLTGIEVDKRVDIEGKPTIFTTKVLVDVFPIRNCGWHITAGFYYGNSRVAKARNTMEEMPSLLAVNIYNHVDEFFSSDAALDPVAPGIQFSPDFVEAVQEKFAENGVMGIHIGDFKDGKPYMMQPGSDGMVTANAFVNRFRPYVGTGFTKQLGKDSRFKFDVDCGVMFWGGSPDIITHDNVNMTKELKNIKGKVGDYVDIAKSLKVYPTVSVRFSYTIF